MEVIENKGANLQRQSRRRKFEGRKELLTDPLLLGERSCAQVFETKGHGSGEVIEGGEVRGMRQSREIVKGGVVGHGGGPV